MLANETFGDKIRQRYSIFILTHVATEFLFRKKMSDFTNLIFSLKTYLYRATIIINQCQVLNTCGQMSNHPYHRRIPKVDIHYHLDLHDYPYGAHATTSDAPRYE